MEQSVRFIFKSAFLTINAKLWQHLACIVLLYPGKSSNENGYWVLITSDKELLPLCWWISYHSCGFWPKHILPLLQESIWLILVSNMIILIGHDDQFADLVILSFFLTADHLNGLSSFGGPLHLIVPAAPHHPYPAFCFCLSGSTRLPVSASWFSGSSRTIGWDFTNAYVLKDACVLAKNNQACVHLASATLTFRQ